MVGKGVAVQLHQLVVGDVRSHGLPQVRKVGSGQLNRGHIFMVGLGPVNWLPPLFISRQKPLQGLSDLKQKYKIQILILKFVEI